jgi:hypothetical protein
VIRVSLRRTELTDSGFAAKSWCFGVGKHGQNLATGAKLTVFSQLQATPNSR